MPTSLTRFIPEAVGLPTVACFVACCLLAPSASATPTPIVRAHDAPPAVLAPAAPEKASVETVLQVDDGVAESTFGFTGSATAQFMFFNRFDSPGPFRLEAVEVVFPAGTEVASGDAVELLVFTDTDGDPTNGATLQRSFDATVQTTDGTTPSVYPLAEPLDLLSRADILVGVVNRYYRTGVDPDTTEPAAVDTTDSQGRSFVALWTGDPPTPAVLGSAVDIFPLDGFVTGNFLIRASGQRLPVTDVPTLGTVGLLLMMLALVGAALKILSAQAMSSG